MVRMRKRRYGPEYDRNAMVDLESSAADAISEISAVMAERYRVRSFSGGEMTAAPWDYIVFNVAGTVTFPAASASNAGSRIAIMRTSAVSATAQVPTGTINGASSYSLVVTNLIREFVSSGAGWCSNA